jgi:hypothetical protein
MDFIKSFLKIKKAGVESKHSLFPFKIRCNWNSTLLNLLLLDRALPFYQYHNSDVTLQFSMRCYLPKYKGYEGITIQIVTINNYNQMRLYLYKICQSWTRITLI